MGPMITNFISVLSLYKRIVPKFQKSLDDMAHILAMNNNDV